MSSEWKLVTLKEITSVLGDGLHGTPEYDPNGDYFFINGNNLSDGKIVFSETTKRVSAIESNKHKKNLTDRTILVSINGTLGNVAFYAGEKVVLGKSACYFNVMDSVDKHFIRYVLDSEIFQGYIQNLATGSTIKNVSLKLMRDFQFNLPPIDIQRQISGALSCLDDRITLLRETNTTLEAIAQALFKSWFVDFDPVHAKMQGGVPEGMDEATAALFPDGFEESELGLVPRGWRVVETASVTDILNGFAFKSDDYVPSETGIFVLRTTNFSSDGYATRLEKDVFLPNSYISSHQKFLCQAFDFHLVMVGASVGHTSLLLPHMLPALRNQNMWCFRAKPSFPPKFFIHELVKINLKQALRSTSGSAREFLRKSDFSLIKVLIPSESILTVFENQLAVLKDSIANNMHQASTLASLRDTLLPRLISGQLRVGENQVSN